MMHQNVFISIQACALHVAFQLPNKFTCAEYLLNNIKNNDPGLQAAIADVLDNVGTPTVPRKRSNFELATVYFLPKDAVMKHCTTVLKSKRFAADIVVEIV